MSNLRTKIEDMLSAIAFAEEGEFETMGVFIKERDSMRNE
jgi:hypothetical protein